MSNESTKFDWSSPEAEKAYKIFSRVYFRSLKDKFAFLKHSSISPSDFNNIFISDEWMVKVRVYLCCDFEDPSFDFRKSPEEFGKYIVETFNDVINLLSNFPEIKEKFITGDNILNRKEFCDKITKEKETIKEEKENKIPEKLRRRLDGLDSGINYLLRTYYTGKDICERYVYDEYVQVVTDAIAERMYYVHFSDLDDTGEEWYEIYTGIMNYIESKWEDRLIGIYNRTCGTEENINEDVSDRVRDRFYNFLNNNSLMTAISFFGHDKVSELLDVAEISKEDKIKFIKDVIDEYGPLSIHDLNEDPIFYGRTKGEYREIYYFGKTTVSVKVWDDYYNEFGDFDVSYEALDDSSIYDIFEILYEYHEEENKKTLNESNFMRRRVHNIKDGIEASIKDALDYVTFKFNDPKSSWYNSDFETFKRVAINILMDHLHPTLSNWGENHFPYDEVYEFLEKNYHDRILERWNELSNNKDLKESVEKKKIPQTVQKLIKELPDELKKIFFNQWKAKQNPEWHPEGNTLKHIIVVIKRAFHHYPDDPNMIMAALFHDLGKMDTYSINPKTNQPTAYGHENKSTDYVDMFKDWIESFEGTDVDEVKYLVKNHMLVKPRTWDSMKDKKKEPIQTHKSFDKLKGFTDKLDGGGTSLNESTKKYETIKKLIDNAIDELKHICETQNDEDNEYVYYGVCELLDYDPKFQINNIEKVQGKMYIELTVNYKNYHHYFDEESLEWEIYGQLKKWIPNCAIKIVEMINNYPEDQRQW